MLHVSLSTHVCRSERAAIIDTYRDERRKKELHSTKKPGICSSNLDIV